MGRQVSQEDPNPIMQVHALVHKNCWSILWENPEALALEVPGHWSSYRVFLIWKPHMQAFHLSIALGLDVPQTVCSKVWELLSRVNARQWFGHFDLCAQESILYFRHAVLSLDPKGMSPCYLEEILSLGIQQVEALFPVFSLVVQGKKPPLEAMELSVVPANASGQLWKC